LLGKRCCLQGCLEEKCQEGEWHRWDHRCRAGWDQRHRAGSGARVEPGTGGIGGGHGGVGTGRT
jgi:hypothetical protein